MTSGTLVIWSLSRLDNGTRRPCPDGFNWSAGSSMNCQWYGTLEEIDSNTRCYWLLLLSKCHDLPDTCMYLLLFLIIYPIACYLYTCYFTWYMLHFLWWHTTHVLHCIYSVFCIPCRHLYCRCTTQYCDYIAYAHLHVHVHHVTTNMFISITSPLANIIYDINWIWIETWPDDNRLSDGIKRWPVYIFLLLTCLYISTAYYMLIIWYH